MRSGRGIATPNRGQGTGILYDLGTHIIDQAVVLFGRPVAVYADVAVRRPGEGRVDDDAFVALHYPGGPRVHLWTSAAWRPTSDRGFACWGVDGPTSSSGSTSRRACCRRATCRPSPDGARSPRARGAISVAGAERRAVPTIPGSYGLFYAGMAPCLLDGGPPPVDIADAIVTAEVIEAARRSSSAGVVAPLDEGLTLP